MEHQKVLRRRGAGGLAVVPPVSCAAGARRRDLKDGTDRVGDDDDTPAVQRGASHART